MTYRFPCKVAGDAWMLRPAGDSVTGEADKPVSLRQRAWLLVDMMRRAHAAGESIVWARPAGLRSAATRPADIP